MPITVQDCLTLPSLKYSTVVAGHGGLNSVVSAVTVLEGTDPSDLKPSYLSPRQIVISSMIAIRKDVDKQCELIRILARAQQVGVIIFMWEEFVSQLAPQVIDVANELGFPLICIKQRSESFQKILFTNIIHDIIDLMHRNELLMSQELLQMLADLPVESLDYYNFRAFIDAVAAKYGTLILLLNSALQPIVHSELPGDLATVMEEESLTAYDLIELGKQQLEVSPQFLLYQPEQLLLPLAGTLIAVFSYALIDKKSNRFCLWFMGGQGKMSESTSEQIAYAIQQKLVKTNGLFLQQQDENHLIKAILEGQEHFIPAVTAATSVDLNDIYAFWLLFTDRLLSHGGRFEAGKSDDVLAACDLPYPQTLILDGSYRGMRTLFFNRSDYEETLDQAVFNHYLQGGDNLYIFTHSGVGRIGCVAKTFSLLKTYFHNFQQIFPRKRIITHNDLYFVEFVNSLRNNQQVTELAGYDVLAPIKQDEELISLLAAMLLDTNMDVKETSNQLFLHRNTIYYRLKKIRSILGFDPFVIPAVTNVVQELALYRLSQTP